MTVRGNQPACNPCEGVLQNLKKERETVTNAGQPLVCTSTQKQITLISYIVTVIRPQQHAHSYFCLGVHVPPGVSIWGYMFIFEGTHILELFFHSKRIEAMKSDHLDVYNSDIIML